ncbi:MAG: hypothetical protein V3S55_10045 [Nitrospiraceae bacterium]
MMALEDDDKPDRKSFYDRFINEFANPVDLQLQLARDALTMLAMIRGFAQEDLAIIAETAAGDQKWADDLAASLEEETGARFHLTARQWGIIHTELGGTA